MKILAIRIKNLASLEGITEIDFTSEPLASAGIFAITGPTGAGKSTLLDALCLALYGKTPRYLQAKEMGIEIHDVQGSTMSQGDVRGILRDGTSEGFAEVDFVGTDGQFYRSNWSVRRARNKAEGSMQADTIALKNISTHLDLPGKKAETFKEIERLVGLNFEQFTRSVLLAQGDFTAFMKASKDEKSSLLEKLTGTHIYSEISKRIFDNYRHEEQLLRELHIRSQGIMTLSEEEIREINLKEADLIVQIKQLTLEIEALSKEINWHEQLAKLEVGKQLATENGAKTTESLLQSAPRKQHLDLVEQAQTTRTWNDALLYNRKQLAEQKSNLALLTVKKAALVEEYLQLEEASKKQELHLSEVVAFQKEALPKLATAKKLDTLIAEKEKQKDVAKSEVDLAKNKQENHQKQVAEKDMEIAKFSAEIKTIQEWQTKYDPKKPIAENKDLIVSKLIDAEKWLASLRSATAEKKNLDEQIVLSTAQIKTKKLDFELLETNWNLLQKNYDVKSTAVLLIPIEQLTIDKDETDRLINKTVEAQSVWNVLFTLQNDFEALRQKQAKDQEAVLQKNKHLQQLKTQVERNFIAKETSEKLLQKARLSATENVESLRAALVDNEPCLVCGSEEHPYILHNPQLEKVLTALEELHQNNEKLYLISFGENSSLEQEIKNLNELIVKQETEITSKKEGVELKNKEWENTLIAKDAELITREEKATWLDAKIKQLKTRQAEFQEQIKAHSDQKNQLEKDKIQLDIQKERKTKCSDALKELKSQLSINTEKWEGFNKEILQTEKTLSEIKNGISSFFVASDWMEKWKEKPKEFVTSIVNFSQEWKMNSEKLEFHNNQKSSVSATIIQLKNQAKSLEEEMALKTTHFNVLSEDLDIKKAERNLIFDGKPAEPLELEFGNAVEEARKNGIVIQNNLQQNKVNTAATEAQNKEIVLNISKFNLEIERSNSTIENWLNELNQKFEQPLTLFELTELLTFTSDWIENERKVMNGLAEEKIKATSVLLERTQILEEHLGKRPSERFLEDLKILHENVRIQNENFLQTKANLTFKLKEDATNNYKMGDLLKEISIQAKTTDNWDKLNDIIGSADGKKFRQIAQEHTLEVLLSYANLHLRDLTNRYKIERIPNTLGLQVVDLDMGDEIRTVYSLSGGESFLVSLALALGLASLSSSKMKVESLFIDEGFGSLDPNTLNVAMDALERLHNLGRKVGVISHVQEMTERIPVQIKVSKKASGRSLVEIVGN